MIRCAALACLALLPGELEGRRPNIIVILTDDQGYGDLGRHGNPVIETPNLDRLHDESVRFTDFHVSPTCSPTRAALLSGRHEFKVGVTHTIHERERLSLKATTVAQVLKSAGYKTGIFGKWHLGDEAEYRPDRRGFDEVFIHGAGGIGQSYPGSCGDAPKNSYFDPVILHNGTFVKTAGYCTDVFFAQAQRWVEAAKGTSPFFCWIATNAPHAPHHVPARYEQRYLDKGVTGEPAKFLGMVSNIDENVGRLLETLRALGLEKDTLVVFMNDNGGTAGTRIHNAGMKGQKGTAHRGGSRGISFWRWPGTLAPGAVDALTAHVDLFPTFAALAGAGLPGGLEGRSLLPLLKDATAAWADDRLFVTHVGRWGPGAAPEKFGKCSVRWREYLLVREGPRWGLYDLKADIGETRDLAGERPEVVERLVRAYDAWWEQTRPCLDNEEAHKTAPKANPFKALYWAQFKGPGPNDAPPPD
ncbi:MAG TPA: arylsulfatase [Planctomycetota bacterium]|nr:arylsulfatase [Planctomycetota bacterium]